MNENNANFTPAAPNFKTLVRMSFQGLTNFPYIEEDFDALTNYGLLSKVVEYLNEVISNNKEQNTVITNLYNAYVSLQDYVNNYFDNLDVQEEVNNKLDEMAQDGSLAEIINNYTDIPDIKEDIKELQGNYIIDEITLEKRHYNTTNTDYYIVHIPHTDSEGNIIQLKRGFANDNITNITASETARSFANRKNATLCINASIFDNNSSSENYKDIIGLIINNGSVVHQPNSSHPINQILGIKEDNSLIGFDYDATFNEITESGCVNTVNAFQVLISGGVEQELFEEDKLYQWIEIGQDTTTKDLYIIVCDGKGLVTNQGMYKMTLANILKTEFSCDFVYQLDGGGSSSLIYKGEFINFPSDGSERKVPDFIYFSKDPQDKKEEEQSDINARLGKSLLENKLAGEFPKIINIIRSTSDLTLNDITECGIAYVTSDAANSPYSDYDGLVTTYFTNAGNSLQVAYPFNIKSNGETLDIKRRRRINGVWENWTTNKTDWTTITNDYGSLSYRIINDVIYLNGSFSGYSDVVTINIPITLAKTGYGLCCGNATNYTKCVMNTNGNFQIFLGTGDTSTTYNVSCSFPIK